MKLTKEEKNAINTLKRLEKKWPKSLWLFSASGTLCVMRKDNTRERRLLSHGGVDDSARIATINIENDGGDW